MKHPALTYLVESDAFKRKFKTCMADGLSKEESVELGEAVVAHVSILISEAMEEYNKPYTVSES